MHFADRLQRALDSQLAAVLLVLIALLAVLAAAYAVMLWRQRQRDLLAYLNRGYYERAEHAVKGFSFTGAHRADFFGRVSPVLTEDRTYGLCLIPPPDALDDNACARFRSFSHALHGKKLPLFAPLVWKEAEQCLVTIQGKLVQHDGRPLLQLQHYLSDKRLGKAYTEEILLEIARAFGELHTHRTDEGEPLYHGFLLPRSLYIEFDVNRTINSIVIADLGMAMTIGPHAVHERITKLQQGKLPIDRFAAMGLLEHVASLAPEQRDPSRLNEVGPASDFYAYGALATVIFTQRPFSDVRHVRWDQVPERWRPFLKACLSERPSERPKDFLELHDWVSDPELALTLQHADLPTSEAAVTSEPQALDTLAGVLEKVQARKAASVATSDEIGTDVAVGMKAIKMGRWEKAREHLLAAHNDDDPDAEVAVSLAIACYELGDLENAERYYNSAKEKDPTTARCFRDHIAFRV